MDKVVRRALNRWTNDKRAELSPRVQRLITLANWDLYNGPTMDGQDDDEDAADGSKVKYPGFVPACQEIAAGIAEILHDVWVDVQTEEVTSEPQSYHDGDEWVEPCWEDYALVEARHVKYVLLGSELARHV